VSGLGKPVYDVKDVGVGFDSLAERFPKVTAGQSGEDESAGRAVDFASESPEHVPQRIENLSDSMPSFRDQSNDALTQRELSFQNNAYRVAGGEARSISEDQHRMFSQSQDDLRNRGQPDENFEETEKHGEPQSSVDHHDRPHGAERDIGDAQEEYDPAKEPNGKIGEDESFHFMN
jgi:hypothetical protein